MGKAQTQGEGDCLTGLKIAIVNDTFYPYTIGGAEKRYWELAQRLAREHEVHMFTMQWPGMKKNMVIKGVKVHAVCRPATQLYNVNNKRSFVNTSLYAIKLMPYFLKDRFDVVDCNNSPFLHYFAARIAGFRKKTPWVTIFHEVWDDYWDNYFANRLLGLAGRTLEILTLHTCTTVVVHSQKTKMKCLNMGTDKERVAIIPDGVDMEKIGSTKPAAESSDVIFAGRLISHKHIDMLVNAIARAKHKVPNIKCVIIGEGPEKGKLINQVQRMRLENNVTFLSPLSEQELFRKLKSSKVFVLPSTREGFGLVVLEANGCGLPVITVRHKMNDAYALVKDGENGFVVHLSDGAIGDKLAELLLNLEKLNRMSTLAMMHARGYSWEITADQLSALYMQLSDKAKNKNEANQ